MKAFLITGLILISHQGHAKVSYDLAINKNGYVLQMDMVFKKDIQLQSIVSALKNGELLSKLSPNVVSVLNTPVGEGKYKSLMHVKSYGLHSNLLSMCQDIALENSWSRSCSLQTREMDGGRFMEWKGDDVTCKKKAPDDEASCHFEIKGLPKPLKILGIQIVSAENFSVKAKLQAMTNFFKLYYYIKNYNLSSRLALEKFENSSLKKEMKRFEEEASKEIKSTGEYHHRYFMKDNE